MLEVTCGRLGFYLIQIVNLTIIFIINLSNYPLLLNTYEYHNMGHVIYNAKSQINELILTEFT